MFPPAEKPEQRKGASQCNCQENRTTLAMETARQIAGIHAGSKHCNDEDAQPVLENRERNRHGYHNCLSPERAQEKLGHYEARDDQHGTGSDAAALLRHLDGKSGNREYDSLLKYRNAEGSKKSVCRPG